MEIAMKLHMQRPPSFVVCLCSKMWSVGIGDNQSAAGAKDMRSSVLDHSVKIGCPNGTRLIHLQKSRQCQMAIRWRDAGNDLIDVFAAIGLVRICLIKKIAVFVGVIFGWDIRKRI